jgi:outer membrane protein TolC
MSTTRSTLVLCLYLVGSALLGCVDLSRSKSSHLVSDLNHYVDIASRIITTDDDSEYASEALNTKAPRRIRKPREEELRDLTLNEAIKIGIKNNKIIKTRSDFRARGSALMNNPESVHSIYDSVIQQSGVQGGQRGLQAALSDFDPIFTSSMQWGRLEQVQNNRFLSGGLNPGDTLKDETAEYRMQLEKQMGTGGIILLSHDWDYSLNNVPSRLFGSSYTGWLRADYRHPLLAGAGSEFTDIAGPIFRSGATGVNQGLIIVRINNDISVMNFEVAVRDMLKDIEDLYWDLALAYHTYDSALIAQNSALKTWKTTLARSTTGLKGGASADEALTRENFFESRVNTENALADLFARETELRRILNLPVNDGRLIRPIQDPLEGGFDLNWEVALGEALARRIELRKQKAKIKSLQLQYKAAKSLTKPRLDFVSGYQVNAFGDQLLSSNDNDGRTPHGLRSAYGTLAQGDQTGWNLGVEFSIPIGQRQANAQLRNIELRLLKARSALDAQELEISHELGTAFQSVDRWNQTARSNIRRLQATETRIKALEADFHANRTSLDMLLRAYAGRARASIEYFRSLTEYNKAVAEVHARKGTLLSYNNVQMAEGIWESTNNAADAHDLAEPKFEPQKDSDDSSRGWSESDLSFGKPNSKNSSPRVSPDDFESETPLLNTPVRGS